MKGAGAAKEDVGSASSVRPDPRPVFFLEATAVLCLGDSVFPEGVR